jgi:tetratricopeptide (TPR) repeat protein
MPAAPTYETAIAAGDWDRVEAMLTSAASPATSRDVLDQLSLIQYRERDFRACERTLERLLSVAPDAPLAVYQRLAKVTGADGRPDEARAVMARGVAAHPGATDFIAAYADMLPVDEAIRELEKHLETIRLDPVRAAYTLVRLSTYRAPGLRAARGLPAHGTSWPDTYRWPDEDALAEIKDALNNEIVAGSRRASAWADLACVAIAEGNWNRAEECFAKLRHGPKRTSADFHAFGERFHAELDAVSDADIARGLAPVERLLTPAFQADVGVFIASDPVYFERFTLPFLRQVEAAGLPLDIQAHILDGNREIWTGALQALESLKFARVTLTAEASGAALEGMTYARLYYHAVRYIRAFEELKRTGRPMWVLDADVRLQRDPRALFSAAANYDLAVSTRPAEFSPSLKMSATCVGIAPSPRGVAFARRVAAYIAHWKKRGTWGWGVDQAALFSSYAHMCQQGLQPSTLFLDDAAMNDKTGDGGALKFFSGIDKYAADLAP